MNNLDRIKESFINEIGFYNETNEFLIKTTYDNKEYNTPIPLRKKDELIASQICLIDPDDFGD